MRKYAELAGKNYFELVQDNFLHKIKHLIVKEGQTEDGRWKVRLGQDPDGPWIYTKSSDNRACFAWHHVYFKIYDFIPKACMQCWKVVARLHNLRQAVEMLKWQEEMGWPAKVGREMRDFVHGNWGAYWYTDSKEEGLERWEEVKRFCSVNPFKGVEVGLKRGCTEFEHRFGPSDQWEYKPEWEELERKLNNSIVWELAKPPVFDEHVLMGWIHWAYSRGDKTYKMFLPEGCDDLFPSLVWYHPKPEKVKIDPMSCDVMGG